MKTRGIIQGKTGAWEVVMGLEVHAQVISQAKLFSGAATSFPAPANSQVSFVDAGMPGMLPVLNKFCVEQAVKTGLGLNAEIHSYSRFDRKNYFYPDLPNGYQISQFYHPIVGEGYLDVDSGEGDTIRIGIERVHLEQDAGKSLHDLAPNMSLLDYNRAGVALMEIVTRPDLRTAEEVMSFVKKLRLLLRYLKTSDANMEEGNLRADVNISLRRPEGPLGTRAEIKNVNSIRFIGQAIAYEVQRQMDLLESGELVIQETRLFDAQKGITRSMRSKEEAQDYRYFPDPDLLPIILEEEYIEKIRSALPELPDAKVDRFCSEYGLTAYDARVLVSEIEIPVYYEAAVAASKTWNKGNKSVAKQIANWLMGEVFAALKREDLSVDKSRVAPQKLAALVDAIESGVISGKIAKEVFATMWETQDDPERIIKDKGLIQISDTTAIEAVIDEIVESNMDKVEQYLAGKEKLFGFFVGQVMKEMAGKANPKVVNDLLQKKLNKT